MQARATEGDRRVGGWKRWVARDRPATGGIEENGQRKGGRELARMPEGRKVGGKGGPRDARKGWQGGGGGERFREPRKRWKEDGPSEREGKGPPRDVKGVDRNSGALSNERSGREGHEGERRGFGFQPRRRR